ncbi:hypothetical protein [Nitrosospira sp. Nsp1]|uniref:hypothetical protein n=1 Tax=Nitrosospira sp. Nsp1 TaxID=136547 RepID=UPI0008859D99|nr:hypothetical protein [Nitrosospira sp. Nsp1]SCX46368.1 hypothetical protein SAMN05720354_106104 [Nitrosospira sp. Nsp1]
MVRALDITGLSRLALTMIFLAMSVSGCASFKEIKAFASLSSSAATHDALTRDYIGALDRRKQYQPQKFHSELEAQKMRREAQRASLDMLQQTVTDYMQGLGGLAAGEIRTYDKSLDDLSDRLNKVTLLSDDEKDAVGALSTLLARTVTAAYREHEIRKLIRDGNQPLQDVIKATRKIVVKGMAADLQVESALVGRYYDNFIFAPNNPQEPIAMALADEARVEALGRVDNRLRAARSYDVILEKIAQGHQYLFDHRDSLGDEALERQFKPYVDALRAAYADLLDVSR